MLQSTEIAARVRGVRASDLEHFCEEPAKHPVLVPEDDEKR
jgi:hypothetical protein